MKSPIIPAALATLLFIANPSLPAAEVVLPNVTYKPAEVFNLWPGAAPGETGTIGPEHVLTDRPRAFDQITDVSVPTLSVFLPAPEKRDGTAMLVIPGGGLDRLAIETEGYEIAEWLNDHGIAAFMLKYRVPPRSREQRWKVGVQDAQRAMGLIRQRAAEWQVDSDAIGAIGFSAGGEINVMLSVYWNEPRQYPAIDAADTLSTRPDFNICLYGGGFTNFGATALREDIASRLNKSTPPMFISHAFDDQALSSVVLMGALKRANVPSEIHIYAAGAHGFGVRESGLPINQWRDECLTWLAWQGYLDSAAVRSYAKAFSQARDRDAATLPRFSADQKNSDLSQAFAAQRRIVRDAIGHGAVVAGYKAAFTTAAAQKVNRVTQPMHGVLFKSGRIDASATTAIAVESKHPVSIETQIGYVIANDIGTKLRVPRQALTTVEGLVPVVELPANFAPQMGGVANAFDAVAVNLGSNQFIVGATVASKDIETPDAVTISLQRDGERLHVTTGAEVKDGQARNLMAIINQIIEQGNVLHRGDIVLCGALGGAQPGVKGNYVADFGKLGVIKFSLE
jgi:2-keto-4-pentenoate hydratase/acetyl esterase/lipase